MSWVGVCVQDFGIKNNCENGGPAPESLTDKIYKAHRAYQLILLLMASQMYDAEPSCFVVFYFDCFSYEI
jgi:phosphoglucomutase